MTTPKDKLPTLPQLALEAIKNFNPTSLERVIGLAKEGGPERVTEVKGILENQMQGWDDKILADEKTLNAITEAIRVLRTNDFPIDLSCVPKASLSQIMKKIFLLKPSDALWLLNHTRQISQIEYVLNPQDNSKIQINILDPAESTAAFYFLSTLNHAKSLKIKGTTDLYKEIIKHYMRIDSEHAVTLALQAYMHMTSGEQKISPQEIYQLILMYDSPHCLKEFLKHVKNDPFFSLIFDPNDTLSKKMRARAILLQAINANAPKSVSVLLDSFQFSPTELERFIQESAENSNLVIVLALCRNDFNKAAHYLFNNSFFSNTEEAREKLYNHLITMLRFTPIELLDNIVNSYDNDQNKTALQNMYRQAKGKFLQYAPAFSRMSLRESNELKTRYHREVSASRDMEYGVKRSELVKSLIEKIKNSTPEHPFKPTKPELLELPASRSKHGSRIFAALLENIAAYNHSSLHPNTLSREEFLILNQDRETFTPTTGYAWARPLISAVFQHSQSQQLVKYHNLEKVEVSFFESDGFYSLTYRGKPINHVGVGYQGDIIWGHGKLPLEETTEDIEDLLEKMIRPLKQDPGPKATAQEIKEYREELTEFYSDAAKLAWLIGNTTPLKRGSGSVAELTLKTVFELQGLQAPTLKPEFPQLDVLDITFPLDDYMKLFTYFCEPSSLPEHLRKPSLFGLSASEQIVFYYNEINKPAFIPESSKNLSSTDAYAAKMAMLTREFKLIEEASNPNHVPPSSYEPNVKFSLSNKTTPPSHAHSLEQKNPGDSSATKPPGEEPNAPHHPKDS